jgi:adhesin HecA-like repeat protein
MCGCRVKAVGDDGRAVVVAAGSLEVGGEGILDRPQGLVQSGGKVRAVADQGQVDTAEGL